MGSVGKKLVVILVSASVLVPSLGARAHFFKQSSTVSIRYDKPFFKGRVRSDRQFCVKNRRVVIHREREGLDPIVASDTTNDNGYYKAMGGPAVKKGKSYYAIAKRKKKKKHRHSHVCKRARSKTITI